MLLQLVLVDFLEDAITALAEFIRTDFDLTAARKGLAGVVEPNVPAERLRVLERESIFVLADPRVEVSLSFSKGVLDSLG